MPSPHHIPAPSLSKACKKCANDRHCPKALKVCCGFLRTILRHKEIEPHSCVHAARDVASRCAVSACRRKKKNWKECCMCCFHLCDALDRFCHQRISLPDALSSDNMQLLCAFQRGLKIPGTDAYRDPSSVRGGPCIVYCASTSCSASCVYCHSVSKACDTMEYPGGILEYCCRCQCDESLPMPKGGLRLVLREFKKMDFNHCGGKGHRCYP